METVRSVGIRKYFRREVMALNETRGTMVCRLAGASDVDLETPLVRAEVGSRMKVGIQAGDLLLATEDPHGLSARNILPGTIRQLTQRDVIVSAMVDCGGVEFEVHLTLAGRGWVEVGRWKKSVGGG